LNVAILATSAEGHLQRFCRKGTLYW